MAHAFLGQNDLSWTPGSIDRQLVEVCMLDESPTHCGQEKAFEAGSTSNSGSHVKSGSRARPNSLGCTPSGPRMPWWGPHLILHESRNLSRDYPTRETSSAV